jgi:hypothetical protein
VLHLPLSGLTPRLVATGPISQITRHALSFNLMEPWPKEESHMFKSCRVRQNINDLASAF